MRLVEVFKASFFNLRLISIDWHNDRLISNYFEFKLYIAQENWNN
jgi:hypothetical protein